MLVPKGNPKGVKDYATIKDNPDLYLEWGFCLGKTNEWDSALLTAGVTILIRQLGWMNSYLALIVPGLFNAFGTFLLRQVFDYDYGEIAAMLGKREPAVRQLVHRVARNRIPSRWLCALLFVAMLRLLAPVAPATTFSVFNLVPAAESGPPAELEVGPAPERVPRAPLLVRTAAPPPRRPWSARPSR